jgi:hypothetical protein
MTMQTEYRPCYICGEPECHKQVCVDELAADALFQRRVRDGEITADGTELGDFCLWDGKWFAYAERGHNAVFCSDICAISSERD